MRRCFPIHAMYKVGATTRVRECPLYICTFFFIIITFRHSKTSHLFVAFIDYSFQSATPFFPSSRRRDARRWYVVKCQYNLFMIHGKAVHVDISLTPC